jgi:polysaccharide biosynthesis PFTS motif protein
MTKFRNEHLFNNFNILIKKIEILLSTKNYNFPLHSNKVINQRLTQKICKDNIYDYGIIANKRIKKDLDPFEKFESKFRLGELSFDFKNNRLKLSFSLILKLFLKFFYGYLKIIFYLFRVFFNSKIDIKSSNILLDENLLNISSNKSFLESLETIKKNKIDVLKTNLLIKSNLSIRNFTKSYVLSEKNPFIFLLRSKEFKLNQHMLLLFRTLVIPLKLFSKFIANPHLILIANDFLLLPLINFLNKNNKINSIVFTTGQMDYQPLWSRDFTNKIFTTHFLNYSNNSNDFIYNNLPSNSFYPPLSLISVDVNWVWSKNQILKYQSLGLNSLFKIVDPIILGLPKKSNKVLKPNNHFSIIVFDVPTFKEDFIKTLGVISYYYNSENMIGFIKDIIDVCSDLTNTLGIDIKIKLKNKRKNHKLYDQAHIKKILKLSSENNNFNLISHDSNIYSLLSSSSCSISIPYTSTASISASFGTPALYYDPTNSLRKPKYSESNIEYIYKKSILKNTLKSHITNNF